MPLDENANEVLRLTSMRATPLALRNNTYAVFPIKMQNCTWHAVEADGIEIQLFVLIERFRLVQKEGVAIGDVLARQFSDEGFVCIAHNNALVNYKANIGLRETHKMQLRYRIAVPCEDASIALEIRVFHGRLASDLILRGVLINEQHLALLKPEIGPEVFDVDRIGRISLENGLYVINNVRQQLLVTDLWNPESQKDFGECTRYDLALIKDISAEEHSEAQELESIRWYRPATRPVERIVNALVVLITGVCGKESTLLFRGSHIPIMDSLELHLRIQVDRIYDVIWLKLEREYRNEVFSWEKQITVVFQ